VVRLVKAKVVETEESLDDNPEHKATTEEEFGKQELNEGQDRAG
jgi:hypothetical protein